MELQRNQACFQHLLQAHEDAQLGMIPSEATLEIDGVGGTDRAIGAQLDGRALHECARRHNDIGLIPRYRVPGCVLDAGDTELWSQSLL